MFNAAFTSAFPTCPQDTHLNFDWVGRFSAATYPQRWQVWLVCRAGTRTTRHAL